LRYLCHLQKLLTILFFWAVSFTGLGVKAGGTFPADTEPATEKSYAKACNLSFPHPVAEPVELLVASLLAKHRVPVFFLSAVSPVLLLKNVVITRVVNEQAPWQYIAPHHLQCLYPFHAFW
jgi:hypothetical protein